MGVINLIFYRILYSDYMIKKVRKVWFEERAFLVLVIVVYRGYEKLVKRFIEVGGNFVNYYIFFIIFLLLSYNELLLRLNVIFL